MNEESDIERQIPDQFASIEEAAAFWEEHDLGDYWDEMVEVDVDVRAPRRQWVALASHLAIRTAERAQKEGVSLETIVNLWIAERLNADR